MTQKKFIQVYDVNGGALEKLMATQPDGGGPITVISEGAVTGLVPSGLGSTTAGVTDTADKRFVTDAQLAELVQLTALGTEQLLSSTAGVDLNTATPSTLYTVPVGKSAVITKIVIRLASASLTTASISFGFNSAAFNDVIANATHTELTGNTLYTVLQAKAGAKIGAAGDVLKVLANTLQGGAATVTISVYGYLY